MLFDIVHDGEDSVSNPKLLTQSDLTRSDKSSHRENLRSSNHQDS